MCTFFVMGHPPPAVRTGSVCGSPPRGPDRLESVILKQSCESRGEQYLTRRNVICVHFLLARSRLHALHRSCGALCEPHVVSHMRLH